MPKSGDILRAAALAVATAGVYVMTRDVGVTVTFPFAGVALWTGRGTWLRHLLAIYWTANAILLLTNTIMATVVASYAVFDLVISGTAVLVLTRDRTRRDAQVIGAISMALMPFHWVMAASHGRADWLPYASILNAAFALQCLIIAGLLDGLGRSISRFFGRLRAANPFVRGG